MYHELVQAVQIPEVEHNIPGGFIQIHHIQGMRISPDNPCIQVQILKEKLAIRYIQPTLMEDYVQLIL